MLDSIVTFLDKLVEDFTWKRFSLVVVVVALLTSMAILYEGYTNQFQLGRMERELDILSKAAELASTNGHQQEKDAVTTGLKHVLETFNDRYSAATYFAFSGAIQPWVEKAALSALPWVCLVLGILLSQGSGSRSAIGGILIFAVPFTLLGTYLPDFDAWWINAFAYPWGSMAACVTFVMLFSAKASRLTSRSSADSAS